MLQQETDDQKRNSQNTPTNEAANDPDPPDEMAETALTSLAPRRLLNFNYVSRSSIRAHKLLAWARRCGRPPVGIAELGERRSPAIRFNTDSPSRRRSTRSGNRAEGRAVFVCAGAGPALRLLLTNRITQVRYANALNCRRAAEECGCSGEVVEEPDSGAEEHRGDVEADLVEQAGLQ